MHKYIAFLRGINVGGNKTVKMDKLKRVLEDNGFTNIKTLLNSGNVIFETKEKDQKIVAKRLEGVLEEQFGFKVNVLVRTGMQIKALVDSRPFEDIKVVPNTRLYATFLTEPRKPGIKMPYGSEKEFKILQIKDQTVLSVLTLSPRTGTLDLMDFLAAEFGKDITTRNWNTVEKACKILEEMG